MAQGTYGTPDNPLAAVHSDRVVFTGLTSDPANTEQGDFWYRSDLLEWRFDHGTEVFEIPTFHPGESGAGVEEVLRPRVGESDASVSRDADNGSQSLDDSRGIVIETHTEINETTAIISSNVSGATTAYLLEEDGTEIESSAISGGEATFTTALSANTEYRIEADDGGASYTVGGDTAPSFPYTGNHADIVGGSEDGVDSPDAFNILTVETTVAAGERFIPTIEGTAGAFAQLGFQHDGARYGLHDSRLGIPQNGRYLDGWSDNKLSSRDSYSTTALSSEVQHPSASAYGPPSRPEWTIERGGSGISAQNQRLEMDGSVEQHVYYTDAITEGTWEIDFTSQGDRANVDLATFVVLDQDPTDWDANLGTPDNGYVVEIRSLPVFQLVLRSGGSTVGNLISGTWDDDTNQHTLTLTRDASGNWELFYDGSSVGTATDTTFTSTSGTSIGMNAGPAMHWDNLRVY